MVFVYISDQSEGSASLDGVGTLVVKNSQVMFFSKGKGTHFLVRNVVFLTLKQGTRTLLLTITIRPQNLNHFTLYYAVKAIILSDKL